jgi:hypothetical protein
MRGQIEPYHLERDCKAKEHERQTEALYAINGTLGLLAERERHLMEASDSSAWLSLEPTRKAIGECIESATMVVGWLKVYATTPTSDGKGER